jgi:S-adenosylmethionine/arginine decarboxylase-like enzyme
MTDYGKELIVDIHNCDPSTFTRGCIYKYFKAVCHEIDMERCELFWWDDLETPEEEKEIEPHLVGTSAVQFIKTSNITIHTLDILKKVYINIFSCKEFDADVAANLSKEWFEGDIVNKQVIRRL